MESNIPAILFTEHSFPNIGVDAFVVIGSRIWDLVWRERMMPRIVLESELGRTCQHCLLQFLEDFAIDGVNLGERGLSGQGFPDNWGFGGRLYVNREPDGWDDGYQYWIIG